MKNFLRDMKITTRISLLVCLTLLPVSLVIEIGLRQVNMIAEEVKAMAEEDIALMESVNRITFHGLEQVIHLGRAIQFGKRMAQDEAAKDKFEIEKKNFVKHGQAITGKIEKMRGFTEQMYEKYKTTYRRKNRALQVDYELRSVSKERADYQFLAVRVLNLLSQGKLAEAEPIVQKITKEGVEEEHFALDRPFQGLTSAIEGFARDSIVRAEENKQAAGVGMILTSALVLFLNLIVALFISRGITKPLRTVTDTANRIADGERDIEIEVSSKNELGILADSFNKMTKELQRKTDNLNVVNQQLGANNQQLEAGQQQLRAANQQLESEITERKEAEDQRAQLLRKVESVNNELKDFAYIVSHDLKTPLRGISTLAHWISDDYADKLGADGKGQMELLLSRVGRMHDLIEGILQYSSVGRIREELVEVELGELVPEVIDDVAAPENISITIEDELPAIVGEHTRIMQVFQNLLSNAVKYMDKPAGQIRIGCVDEGDCWKFSVTDNGPGIEERHFKRIFRVFQTVSDKDGYESTGVGLSVVKKIVEIYGGKIWVESEVGKGSSFFFTLAKPERRDADAKLEANIAH